VNDCPSTNPNMNHINHIVNPSTVKLSNTTC
jgi:hypothetical protein